MRNGKTFDTPPPGAGVNTATCPKPPVAMSSEEMDARNCVLLTTTVARGTLFQSTVERSAKFAPVTVSVNPELAAFTFGGKIEVTDGAGF